uniref:Uncharacterized protein n=1 Tax=Steinernema glaseri TaxID=37863 RepID=A0A1I7ZTV8_9BILA
MTESHCAAGTDRMTLGTIEPLGTEGTAASEPTEGSDCPPAEAAMHPFVSCLSQYASVYCLLACCKRDSGLHLCSRHQLSA